MSCMNYALRLSKNEYNGPLGEKEYFENDEEEKKKIKELIEKIKTSSYIVVHAGAGISTSCGLQDFRGPTGIWTNEFLKKIRDKKKKQKERKECLEVKKENSNNSSICHSINKREKASINFIKREKLEKTCKNNEYEKNSVNNNTEENNICYKEFQDKGENVLNNNSQFSLNKDDLINKKTQHENNNIHYPYENLNKNTHLNESNINIKKENPLRDFNKNIPSYDEKSNIKDSLSDNDDDDNESNLSNCVNAEKYVIFGKRKKRVIDLHLALPSKTHIMIKELMNKNIIKFLITQNIDSLHYRCGTKFSKLAEIHGNIFIERCDFCGRRYLRDFVISTISFKPTGSLCFLCSFPPVGICTDVLLDWNNSYEDFFHQNSIKHSQKADFHFCLGSSFYIVPASYYPSKKKFANKNSYSCLINYQKSFLSKEVNLNLHSNVNNISDIIIKEFSLDPLSVRKAKILILRCPLNGFDLLYDKIITIKNMDINTYSSGITKKENSDNKKDYSSNDEVANCFVNNDENNLTEKVHLNNDNSLNEKIHKNNDENSFNNTVPNEQKSNSISEEQIFLIKCSMIKNIQTATTDNSCDISVKQLDKIKGIWLIRSKCTCIIEIELWYNSFILLKLICNKNSSFIGLNTWNVHVAYTYGDDIDDIEYCNNNKENLKSFNLYKNKYIHNGNTEKWYENTSIENENEKIDHNILNNKHINLNNNNIYYNDSNSYGTFNGELKNSFISEILNEHVHVGYNPNNFISESKVELLAILNNSKSVFKNDGYISFELPNAFKLLYNLFCTVNKSDEQKFNVTQIEKVDKCEEFIKNFHLSKDTNFYTNNFINSFVKEEKYASHSHYKFRERKKRKLHDYSSCSDENKEDKIFIFYNLYMNESKQNYKVTINKEFIKNNLDKRCSLKSNYSYENNLLIKNKQLMKNDDIKKCSKTNTKCDIKNMNVSKGKIIHTCEGKSSSENYMSTIEDNDNNCSNIINNENYENAHKYTFNNIDKVNYNKKIEGNALGNNFSTKNTLNEDSEGNNAVKNNFYKKGFNVNSDKSDNITNENHIENITNEKNEVKIDNLNAPFLFYPTILINSKHTLGELVTKVPKYIKSNKVYTPYKKITKDKRFSNTLQKYRYEIWQKTYNEIINNTDKEQLIDSTLYKEICYLPFWLLSYVNDLFECL